MKKVMYLVMAVFGLSLTSCETVAPGHKGVEVSWGGETNMNVICSNLHVLVSNDALKN